MAKIRKRINSAIILDLFLFFTHRTKQRLISYRTNNIVLSLPFVSSQRDDNVLATAIVLFNWRQHNT